MSNSIKLKYLFAVLALGIGARIYYQVLRDPMFLPPYFTVGPLTFHWYGICIVVGMAVAVYLFNKLWLQFANSEQRKKLKLERLFIYLMLGGVVGARIYHLITDWRYYEGNIIAALYIWNGGLGIYGGIIAGVIVLYLYCREKELPFLLLADLAVVVLPLAQTIGRFGNLFNRELFGFQTTLPWGMVLPIPGPSNVFHPTFLYEQVGDIILFTVLWFLVKSKKMLPGKGNLLMLYLAGYALIRFLVDFFRIEPRVLGGIFTTAQTISILIVLMIVVFIVRKKFQRE